MLKNKGITKKQIAEELGVSRETLYYEMRRGVEVKGDFSTYKDCYSSERCRKNCGKRIQQSNGVEIMAIRRMISKKKFLKEMILYSFSNGEIILSLFVCVCR